MSRLIAVTGKGGVGKTTFAAVLVRQLIKNGLTPALAIDADPNSCLDEALGVTVDGTVGGIREDVRNDTDALSKSGVSKHEAFRMRIAESLVETDDFDLIAMGRPEGAGCYCYANNVLKSVISEISSGYPYVVMDNEAGLENLSRRIVSKVDTLFLVSDASAAGMKTITRLHSLAVEMGVKYERLALVVNRIKPIACGASADTPANASALPAIANEIRRAIGADAAIFIPDDAEVASFAESGRCLLELPDGNPVTEAVDQWLLNYIQGT